MKTNLNLRLLIIYILIILLLMIGWVIGKDWLRPTIIKALGGYTQSEMKVTVDTLDIKYNNIYTKYKERILRGDSIIEHPIEYRYKYLPHPNSTSSPTTGGQSQNLIEIARAKRYEMAVNDSILSGKIETILDLDSCKIVAQTFKYTPKIPYIREKIITIERTKQETLSNPDKAYLGLGMNTSSANTITPKVLFLTKKKWLIEGGYEKSLSPLRSDNITVGISKLF